MCFCTSGNLPQRLFSSLACERHLQSISEHQCYWPRAEWLCRLIGRCSLFVPLPNPAPKLPGQPAGMVFALSCGGGGLCVHQQGACNAFNSSGLGRVFSFVKAVPAIPLQISSVHLIHGCFLFEAEKLSP